MFHARVPVRISFLGGGTDCPPFSTEFSGAVINAAISRYVYATVKLGEKGLKILSKDYDVIVEATGVDALKFDGQLDLLKACLKHCDMQTGFTLVTESNVPVGSGLGASGAMSVAVLAAMRHAMNSPIDAEAIAHLAYIVERKDLGFPGGSQDQYGAALGGINFLTFREPNVGIERLAGWHTSKRRIKQSIVLELEKNMLLVYVGESHVSGDIHRDIRAAYALKNSPTKHAMHKLKELADKGREALLNSDLYTFAKLLTENWKWHKELHPSCTNQKLETIYSLALYNGAIGGATCGAGGGGCVIFICEDHARQQLARILKSSGCQIIDAVFDFGGVQVWKK